MTPYRLRVDQPIDLEAALCGGQAFRWVQEGDGWFIGVLDNNVVRLRAVKDGVEVESAPDGPEALALALADYLRLDDDLPAIHRGLSADAQVSAAIRKYPGLRLLRQDPWECLVSFICSSNSSIRQIGRTLERMAHAYGESRRLGALERHTFPSPERLASVGETGLRALGAGFRAEYIAAAAQMVASGGLDVAGLRLRPYNEARAALLGVPGVGPKVAECVLLFSMDKLDAFPVDRWVRRALEEWYGVRRLKPPELRAWALERFGPYAGYANQYLFHHRRLAV
ncbi:MAG: DNA-3-methyladenine glycosylase 2 [Chloroflexi bacterium]|nr:DNA-3-methyladenine glycosylase 2 [Chloroflexota bacterium]